MIQNFARSRKLFVLAARGIKAMRRRIALQSTACEIRHRLLPFCGSFRSAHASSRRFSALVGYLDSAGDVPASLLRAGCAIVQKNGGYGKFQTNR
jgi:hypothetical protein